MEQEGESRPALLGETWRGEGNGIKGKKGFNERGKDSTKERRGRKVIMNMKIRAQRKKRRERL